MHSEKISSLVNKELQNQMILSREDSKLMQGR